MKRAVITGASRGIGKATAAEFLQHGWQVLGTSTSGQGWAQQNLSWMALDLVDAQSIKSAAKNVVSQGPIDVLVDNAGIMERGQDEEGSAINIPALRKILEANLIGTIDFTEQSLSAVNAGGHIVLLGSGLGSLSGANGAFAPSYSISKAALSMYTRKLAARLADRNITVSIVSPGWVKTDMGGESAPRKPNEAAGEIFRLATSKVPSGLFWHQGKPMAW
jgi:NAD(P)-dependent dehydrogenase (short-subunit alcohol dehydrogenase family)